MQGGRDRAFRNALRAVVILVGLGTLVLGGCSQGTKQKYNLAIEENQELRRRVAALQTAKDATDAQNAELIRAMEEMQAELARGTPAPGATSGFNQPLLGSDLAGVTVGTRGQDLVIAVAGDVLFDSGKATIKTSAQRTLDRVADVLKSRYPSHEIRVEGYTDSDPIRKSGWKSNEHLSFERAISVEHYLVSKGIPNDRIYSAAFGPARPRATKQESRRVEIVVLGPTR
ncbi:MAG: OmpA family protein [Phycisphaeraceae bacterium]|nr:OmpA family protein [Phycisphaeraceae bacterium]